MTDKQISSVVSDRKPQFNVTLIKEEHLEAFKILRDNHINISRFLRSCILDKAKQLRSR